MRERATILTNIAMIRERIDSNPNIGPREKLAGEVMIKALRWAMGYKTKRVWPPKRVMREMNKLDYKMGDAL